MDPYMTPMMQQYRDAKERHPGMLLLFRMGDFFELFDDDAETAAHELGLTLTSHRVAVCDQVEDAALAKGLVRREVVRVVTPGTVTEDNLLDPRQSNHLAALWLCHPAETAGLAWLELSTGQFHAADMPPCRL